MEIKVLGSGCANCRRLEANTRDALERLGIDAVIDHVTDPADIAAWGVMRTPALVVDDQVRVSGRVATVDDITGLLAPPAPGSATDR